MSNIGMPFINYVKRNGNCYYSLDPDRQLLVVGVRKRTFIFEDNVSAA
jgi:hypothetical protein